MPASPYYDHLNRNDAADAERERVRFAKFHAARAEMLAACIATTVALGVGVSILPARDGGICIEPAQATSQGARFAVRTAGGRRCQIEITVDDHADKVRVECMDLGRPWEGPGGGRTRNRNEGERMLVAKVPHKLTLLTLAWMAEIDRRHDHHARVDAKDKARRARVAAIVAGVGGRIDEYDRKFLACVAGASLKMTNYGTETEVTVRFTEAQLATVLHALHAAGLTSPVPPPAPEVEEGEKATS